MSRECGILDSICKSIFRAEGKAWYIMEKENSIDIDDEVDFRLAEALLNKKI